MDGIYFQKKYVRRITFLEGGLRYFIFWYVVTCIISSFIRLLIYMKLWEVVSKSKTWMGLSMDRITLQENLSWGSLFRDLVIHVFHEYVVASIPPSFVDQFTWNFRKLSAIVQEWMQLLVRTICPGGILFREEDLDTLHKYSVTWIAPYVVDDSLRYFTEG
jgi:hypothetical protein